MSPSIHLLCLLLAAARADPIALDGATVRWPQGVMSPLDEAGLFWTGDVNAPALPQPSRPATEILARREPGPPLRCRLVDWVDCTRDDTHAFAEDGASRVLDLPGGRFRLTAAPRGFDLAWFRYRLHTADRAGTPHLLVLESPNDRERYTTVTLSVPPGAAWSAPYAGAAGVAVPDPLALCQEPLWYEPDVGLCTYTGRDLATDGRPFLWHLIVYPKAADIRCTISSSGWARPADGRNGGAVSRIWLFEILDPLQARRPRIQPPAAGPPRRLGLYVTHPWYLLAHYGAPPFTVTQRRASLERACDLLAFCGLNRLMFNAVNGSDRAGRTWYPSATGYYRPLVADLMTELPPVAAARGIDLIPVVTSITAPVGHGFTEASFQRHWDPNADPRVFGDRVPDPLRPEVQDWLMRHVVEVAEAARPWGNVTAVGFRVNGKIGTCYAAAEDKTGPETRVVPASEMGYSAWNLTTFRADTGLACPTDPVAAHAWLRAVPSRWDRWLGFRCRRTHAFWCRVRDAVRGVRPDLTLTVLTDLPAEVPATNALFPGVDDPHAAAVTLELLRTHGYDPRLFAHEPGIVVQRVMMADLDRFASKWGPPWGTHPERYRDFHEQPFLPDWYATPAGRAAEIYHTYWEEPFHPDGEFGPDAHGVGLRTATATAGGRAFFRPMTFSLHPGNVDSLVLTGWQRPVLGHEHDLRRFALAFRALPATRPRPLAVAPGRAGLSAAWYGDRLAVINHAPRGVTAELRLERSLPPDRRLVDVVTGRPWSAAGPNAVAVALDPWDLRVAVIAP